MADPFEPSPSSTGRPFLEFRPLLRALGIASDAKKLILATMGLCVLYAGWAAIAWCFGEPPKGSALSLTIPRIPEISSVSLVDPSAAGIRVAEPFRVVVQPFALMFVRGLGFSGWFWNFLLALWGVIVWGIFGGAIARIAVVQAAGDRRVGLRSALRFALGKAASLVGAPLTPLLAIAIFAAFCGLFGLLYRIPWGVGSTLGLVLGFVPLFFGLLMALILVGLALGWPLMHATVAAEGEDAPDALSRSYSYVNQRLPRYLAHLLASWVIGAIGLVVVFLFARVVVELADWGVSLGAPASVFEAEGGASGRLFWSRFAGWVAHAWSYSYFWSSASIIYLILRRDVDGTDWHDVFMPEHEADTFAADLGESGSRETAVMPEAESE